VSDAATLARTARESLARGLNALQSDPNVPPPLLDLAGTIAQAMGALHGIERSNGVQVVPNAQDALGHVQNALARLQAQPPQHPAVAAAMEAVAGALSSVHALTHLPQVAQSAPAAPPARPQTSAQQPAYAPQPPAPYAPQPPAPYGQAPAAHAQTPLQPPAPSPYGAAPLQARPPTATAPAGVPAPAMPLGDVPVVPAELGAHSPSNFYKGLSGNDIVDHGGLFISTYKLPKIGQTVRLKVSMPGGYEFEANAVVRWRREPSDAGSDAPPGFGAQFTEIAPDARHLVYRYVRNREPMFHDDL
jgi:hypothetical protein